MLDLRDRDENETKKRRYWSGKRRWLRPASKMDIRKRIEDWLD